MQALDEMGLRVVAVPQGDVDAVLDGDLDFFIEQYLVSQIQ